MFDVAWNDSWTWAAISLAIVMIAGLGFAWVSRRSRPDDSSGTASADSARWHWPHWGMRRH